MLFDFLSRFCTVDSFPAFCECLIADEQQRIVDTYFRKKDASNVPASGRPVHVISRLQLTLRHLTGEIKVIVLLKSFFSVYSVDIAQHGRDHIQEAQLSQTKQ